MLEDFHRKVNKHRYTRTLACHNDSVAQLDTVPPEVVPTLLSVTSEVPDCNSDQESGTLVIIVTLQSCARLR